MQRLRLKQGLRLRVMALALRMAGHARAADRLLSGWKVSWRSTLGLNTCAPVVSCHAAQAFWIPACCLASLCICGQTLEQAGQAKRCCRDSAMPQHAWLQVWKLYNTSTMDFNLFFCCAAVRRLHALLPDQERGVIRPLWQVLHIDVYLEPTASFLCLYAL